MARAATEPVKTFAEVEAYLTQQRHELRRRLHRYNEQARVTRSADGHWYVESLFWKIERLEGDRVFLVIDFEVGRPGWSKTRTAKLFEMQWRAGDLAFVGHGPAPKRRGKASGWLGDTGKRCTPNYYAPKPCIDTVRRWTEFAEFNGLPMNPESAAIFQAYAQHDTVMGDRLMARARGLPEPTERSAFGLQAEVDAMDLQQYQQNPENPCDLSPYGPKPCAEVVQRFKRFARKHGLPLSRSTGAMFEAYGRGNFVKADVLYAFAKGLPVPSYGYVPTGIGRDAALAGLRLPSENEAGACEPNPYAPKPCLESIEAWRDFAARYGLEDNAANAKAFQAYAEGDLKTGDRLFAMAKGVALDELLKAAGVETPGLVIEVYPGRRQRMDRRHAGT